MKKYEDLSTEELEAIIDNAHNALKDKQAVVKKEAIAKMKKLAASIGVNIEIHEDRKTIKKGKKVDPKYRNPNDPDQTWTGRGVMPKWIKELIDGGADKNDFLIQ